MPTPLFRTLEDAGLNEQLAKISETYHEKDEKLAQYVANNLLNLNEKRTALALKQSITKSLSPKEAGEMREIIKYNRTYWPKLIKMLSDENKGFPPTLDALGQDTLNYQTQLMQLGARHRFLVKYLEEHEPVMQEMAGFRDLDPKAIHLADLTPYALTKLAGELNAVEAEVKSLNTLSKKDLSTISEDLKRNREAIASSMHDRLVMAQDGTPADLVTKLNKDLSPSKAYTLSDRDVRDYMAFIEKHGNQELKNKVSQTLGTTATVLSKRLSPFMQEFDRYAASKTKNVSALSPVNIVQGDWAERIQLQSDTLKKQEQQIDTVLAPAAKIASLAAQNEASSLEHYKSSSPPVKFFRWVFSGFKGQTQREAELKKAQDHRDKTEEKLIAAKANYNDARSTLDTHVKKVVSYVIEHINDEIKQNPEAAEGKIAAVRQFVSKHDLAQTEKLNKALDFSGDLVGWIATGESLEELTKTAACVLATEPHKKDALNRVMKLLSGSSDYDTPQQLDDDIKSILPDRSKTEEGDFVSTPTAKSIDIETEIIKDAIKENYLEAAIHSTLTRAAVEKSDVTNLRKLLGFYSPSEQKEKITTQLGVQAEALKAYDQASKGLQNAQKSIHAERNKAEADAKFRDLASKSDYADFFAKTEFNIDAETDLYHLAETVSDPNLQEPSWLALPQTQKDALKQAAGNLMSAERQIENLHSQAADFLRQQERMDRKLMLVSSFKDAEGYTELRDAAFDVVKVDVNRLLQPDAPACSADDFEHAEKIFTWGEEAKLSAQEPSAARTKFNEALNSALTSQSATSKWDPRLACLIEKHGDADNIARYRQRGMNELMSDSMATASIPAQEQAFKNFIVTQLGDPSELILSPEPSEDDVDKLNIAYEQALSKMDAPFKARLLGLTKEPSPSWMKEIIMRECGSKEDLQNMHARWILDELSTLNTSSHQTSEGTLRPIFEKITAENFKDYVGKDNATQIKDELEAITDGILTSYRNEHPEADESVDVTQAEVKDAVRDNMVRLMGGVVGDKFMQIFGISDRVYEQVNRWKNERDLNQLAKAFKEDIAHQSPLSKKPVLVEGSVADELVKSPEEREFDKGIALATLAENRSGELKREGNYASDSEGESVSKDTQKEGAAPREDAGAPKSEYNYYDDPDTFYTHYLLPAQSTCEDELKGDKIQSAFTRIDDKTGKAVSPEIITREFAEFKEKFVDPLSSFDEKHVSPIMAKIKDCQFTPETFSDQKSLENALLELGSGRLSQLQDCQNWCDQNHGKPGVSAVSSYLMACENAAKINGLLSTAYASLIIKEGIEKLSAGDANVPDLTQLITDHQQNFSEMPFLREYLASSITQLVDQCEKSRSSRAMYDIKDIEKVDAVVQALGDDQQKERLTSMLEINEQALESFFDNKGNLKYADVIKSHQEFSNALKAHQLLAKKDSTIKKRLQDAGNIAENIQQYRASMAKEKLKSALSDVWKYDPIQKTVEKSPHGEVIGFKPLKSEQEAKKLVDNAKVNLFKYKHAVNLFETLREGCSNLDKTPSHDDDIHKTFETVKTHLHAIKDDVTKRGEGDGKFAKIVGDALQKVDEEHKSWSASSGPQMD